MIEASALKNTYFGLRHGESEANQAGIITAGEKARSEYGLTEHGREQVIESVKNFKNNGSLDKKTIIITSPLRRSWESAIAAAEVLGVPQEEVIVDEELRERDFGVFEGKDHEAFREIIWPADFLQKESEHGVESTADVQQRIIALITRLEQKYANQHILLVSHGDTLQILETWFKNISPHTHRSLPHLQNAEIRRYN